MGGVDEKDDSKPTIRPQPKTVPATAGSNDSVISGLVVPSGSVVAEYNPGDLTKQAVLDYTGKSSYAVGDLAGTANSISSSNNNNKVVDMSVLQELEECLSMEKALIEKLGRIQQATTTTTTPPPP